ncbi:MAG TPA: hypothetical protein VF762_02610 [Blastocatellia bacterium]|jgi:hypothetical protein
MFLLSVSSNAGEKCRGRNINSAVSDAILAQIQAWSLTDWKIVWGPAVYVVEPVTDPTSEPGATNVMFVACDQARSSYFISVAGTNSETGSLVGFEEDFRVHEMVPWQYGPDAGKISLGSHLGLTVLQGLKAASDLLDEETTLDVYLSHVAQTANGKVSIITGGHSLGGTLSPLVALWLRDTQDNWDKDHIVAQDGFSCRRSAGVTPGDPAFAAYYKKRLPDTISLINPLDFVTKLWDALDDIPGLYEPEINACGEIASLVSVFKKLVAGKGYTPIGEPDILNQAIVDTAYICACDEDCANFTKQMGYQHVRAYFTLLGLPTPLNVGVDQFSNLCVSTRTQGNSVNARPRRS